MRLLFPTFAKLSNCSTHMRKVDKKKETTESSKSGEKMEQITKKKKLNAKAGKHQEWKKEAKVMVKWVTIGKSDKSAKKW